MHSCWLVGLSTGVLPGGASLTATTGTGRVPRAKGATEKVEPACVSVLCCAVCFMGVCLAFWDQQRNGEPFLALVPFLLFPYSVES